MHKTKLVALLLVVAIVASLVVPSVSAADPYEAYITDEAGNSTTTVEAGQYVALVVSLAGNPGISNLALKLQYPEGWEISYFENFKLFDAKASTLPTFSPDYTSNPYTLMWTMGYGTTPDRTDRVGKKLSFENGDLCLVEFLVPADATSGDYEVSLTTAGFESQNYQMATDADGVITNGEPILVCPDTSKKMTITVQGNEPAGTACPEHTDVNTWTEVAENAWAAGGALTSGHYKLTGNQATTAALTVAEGESVCIDLNGFNITAGAKAAASSVSYRVFTNQGTLAILDTTAAGEGENYTAGTISGGALKEQGNGGDHTTLAACGGNIYNSGTFTLVDGIIADGYLNGGAYDSSDKGGNIFSENGTLNIKGGWIKNGQNKRTSQNGTESAYTGGGNISAIDTDVNITGGMITGGKVYGTYNYSSGTNRKSYLYGGNICVSGGSLDIANATIADGTIEYTLTSKKSTVINYAYGGNIFVAGVGDISIVNSNITGGQVKAYSTGSTSCDVKAQGGNIYMKLSAATSKMTLDATSVISGGLAEGTSGSHAEAATAVAEPDLNYRGGNIYLEKGTLDIYGKITNGSGQRGGAIFTPGSSTINIYEGAELSGSTSTAKYGHEITTTGASSVLNIYGGTITSDKTDDGYTVYALYAPVNIYGGVVANTGSGRAINTYYGSSTPSVITMSAGTVVGYFRVADKCEAYINGGTIDTFAIQGTGKLEIGAGVTSTDDPTAYAVNCEAVIKGDKYVTYATIADAAAAAVSGDTITLVQDATADSVSVKPGVTLDLNGNNLTANEFASAFEGTHIVDNKGTGKLTADSVSMAEGNNQLPVQIGNEYTFEEVTFKHQYKEEATTATYKFYIDSEAAQTMIDDAIKAGSDVAVEVKVSWINAETQAKEKIFVLSAGDLAKLAENWDTKMVVLTITDTTNITGLTCNAQVRCGDVVVEA